VLLLRATIEQARHDFDVALADLDRLVARVPDHQQGHLTRAVVLTVRARYAEAAASCDALADPLVAAICRAPIDAAGGRGDAAIERLATRLPSARPSEAAWALSALGEVLYWRGDGAAGPLARALALDPGDGYTRAVLADLLLDEDRPAEASAPAGRLRARRRAPPPARHRREAQRRPPGRCPRRRAARPLRERAPAR
jgi:predicted Zn-dependent protease